MDSVTSSSSESSSEEPPGAVRVPDEYLPDGVVRHRCQWLSLPAAGASLSYFAFMMVNTRPGDNAYTHIGTSRNPLHKVHAFNEGRVRSRKSTKQGRPYWRLELMVGPFDSSLDADRFREHWDRHKRGVAPRMAEGQRLAHHWGLECWTMRNDAPPLAAAEEEGTRASAIVPRRRSAVTGRYIRRHRAHS